MLYPFRYRFLPLAALFGAVHALATYYSVYWYVGWLDLVMHVWGGALLLLAYGAVGELLSVPYVQWYWRPGKVILYVLVCVILWEIIGVILHGGFKIGWLQDTAFDLVFGILGAMLSYWWSKRYIQNI